MAVSTVEEMYCYIISMCDPDSDKVYSFFPSYILKFHYRSVPAQIFTVIVTV
jgi:hypothetical protein